MPGRLAAGSATASRGFTCKNTPPGPGPAGCRDRPEISRFCGLRREVAEPLVLCYIKQAMPKRRGRPAGRDPLSDAAQAAAPLAPGGRDLYLVKSLVHASEILWAFQHPGETLRLRDVMDRTRFGKGMCFRLLYTLRHCGFLEKVEGNRYRLTSEIRRRKKHRIGYAGAGSGQLVRARSARRPCPRGRKRAGRADRRRQPVSAEDRGEERGAADSRGRRSRDRVPDRRLGRAGDRGQIPGGEHPDDRDRHPPSGRDLLRGEQLRGRSARRAIPGALGAAALGRESGRDPAARAGARRLAARVTHPGIAGGPARGAARGCRPGRSSRSTATVSSGRRWSASASICGSRRGRGFSSRPRTTPARSAPRGRSRKPAAPTHARSSGRTRSRMPAPSCASRARRSLPRSGTFPRSTATG